MDTIIMTQNDRIRCERSCTGNIVITLGETVIVCTDKQAIRILDAIKSKCVEKAKAPAFEMCDLAKSLLMRNGTQL